MIKISIFIIFLIILVIGIKYSSYSKAEIKLPKKYPITEVKNDKLVSIKNIYYSEVKKAVQQFCKKYNEDTNDHGEPLIAKLVKISPTETVILFPYNTDFDMFSFLVNYLYYPENIFYKGEIKAWMTVDKEDASASVIADKKIMMYIPSEDSEYDNVYLVTQENIYYKNDFSKSNIKSLDNSFYLPYKEPPYNHAELKRRSGEEIR